MFSHLTSLHFLFSLPEWLFSRSSDGSPSHPSAFPAQMSTPQTAMSYHRESNILPSHNPLLYHHWIYHSPKLLDQIALFSICLSCYLTGSMGAETVLLTTVNSGSYLISICSINELQGEQGKQDSKLGYLAGRLIGWVIQMINLTAEAWERLRLILNFWTRGLKRYCTIYIKNLRMRNCIPRIRWVQFSSQFRK